MKQRLAIGFDAHFNEDGVVTKYTAQIIEQSHRSTEFGDDGEFTASNGLRIVSNQFPDNGVSDSYKPTLYTRGILEHLDNETFIVTPDELPKIVSAVREFNSYEFGGYETSVVTAADFDFIVR